MKQLFTLLFITTLSFGYGQTTLITYSFDSDAEGWIAVGDGTADDAVFSYESTLGNPGGAILIGGSNDGDPANAGRGFQTQIATGADFNFGTATYLEVTFDLKLKTALTGTAVHLQTETPAGVKSHNDLQNDGLNTTGWTSYTKTISGLSANSTGVLRINFNLAAGANIGDGGELLIDNVVVKGYDVDPNKYITVTVDASELTNNPGFNIVSNHIDVDGDNGSGGNTGAPDGNFTYHDFREYVATNNGDGTFSYTFTNIPNGQKIEYVWKAYGNDNSQVQENLGLIGLIGDGQYENYLLYDIPIEEKLVTDYGSYGNRTVTSDGENYTAQTYYFHSIRRPGVTYPEITLAAPSGKEAFIKSSLNWGQTAGAGGKDNGDGTYTAIVLPSQAFEYTWTYDGVEEDLSPNPNGGQNCTGDSSIVNAGSYTDSNGVLQYFGNRVHGAGESRTDTFNTCPQGTLSIFVAEFGEINIYPNPFVDRISIITEKNIDQVSIFDLTGRQVLRAIPNAESFSLDVSNLNKGMYLVSLKAGDQEMTAKLVK